MLSTLTWLLLFQLVGEVTVRWLKLPLPGSVVGMVLLFAVLVLRGGVPEHLRAASHTLLQHLMLLLVPASTAVMLHFKRLGEAWLPICWQGLAARR
jgi:holin-like protein